jgi:hypothetical protein
VLDAERDIGARLALQLVRERHLVSEDDHLAIGCEASDRPGDVAAALLVDRGDWVVEDDGATAGRTSISARKAARTRRRCSPWLSTAVSGAPSTVLNLDLLGSKEL